MGFFKDKKDFVEETMSELKQLPALEQQAMEQAQALMGGQDLQALAAQAMQMASGGGMAELMAYRDRATKLMQHGVQATATIKAVREGATSPLTGSEVDLDVTVKPPSGAPYDATIKQYFPAGAAQKFTVGSEIGVRIDPDDPQSLLVWGAAPAGAAPSAESTRLQKLEQLGEQRKAGTITEEEFEKQKAAILGEA
jgi:hypothetical protein